MKPPPMKPSITLNLPMAPGTAPPAKPSPIAHKRNAAAMAADSGMLCTASRLYREADALDRPAPALWYLASPYSNYEGGDAGGRELAWLHAAEATALLTRAGVPVFSPIVHSHPLATVCGLDLTHVEWLAADLPFMDAAKGCIVLRLPGWDDSAGVTFEMRYFRDAGKPVVYMDAGKFPEWT